MSGQERYVVAVGPVCVDEYYTADEWVREGSKALVRASADCVGGMIPNAACVFAGYGVKTCFFDVMNTSPASQRMLEDLKSYRLDVSAVAFDESLPDAKCIIVLTPGDRTILVVDGRKPRVTLEGERLDLFRNAAYIYSTVYEFAQFQNAEALADDLKAHGAKLVFDVEATAFDRAGAALLGKADVLFFNQYGFERHCDGESPETCYQRLFRGGVQVVTVTLGKDGSYTRTPNGEARVKAIDLPVVDPTGAGDTFNSSFVRCLLEGYDIHYAARFANMAASFSVTQMGPKGGVQPVSAVEELMARHYGQAAPGKGDA